MTNFEKRIIREFLNSKGYFFLSKRYDLLVSLLAKKGFVKRSSVSQFEWTQYGCDQIKLNNI